MLKKDITKLKLWVDDVRPAPEGYVHLHSVNEVKRYLMLSTTKTEPDCDNCDSMVKCRITHEIVVLCDKHELPPIQIEVLDLDHDAGEYAYDGGDYIKILDFMEGHKIDNIPIHIHSMNPVGVQNMRTIIQHNNWKEV